MEPSVISVYSTSNVPNSGNYNAKHSFLSGARHATPPSKTPQHISHKISFTTDTAFGNQTEGRRLSRGPRLGRA